MCSNTRCQHVGVWGWPDVNKLEQVSSDGHQISLAGGPVVPRPKGEGPGRMGGL